MWARILFLLLFFFLGTRYGEAQQYPAHSMLIGAGPGTTGFNILGPCAVGQVPTWVSGVSADPTCGTPPGTGTVLSVGLILPPTTFIVTGSPITASGTFTGTFTNQSSNTVFAGPTSGPANVPTWRALVGADLPTPTTNALGGVQAVTAVAHQWISSISASGIPGLTQPAFSDISGVAAGAQLPAPTTSTLGGVFANTPVTSNWVSYVNSGGTPVLSQPSFNDISGSLGVNQISTIGAFNVIANATSSSAVPTAVSTTALIDAAFGSVQGDILYRGASAWTALAPGTSGQVLTAGGASANPSWTSVSGTGTMTSITAGTSITLSPTTCTSSCSVGISTIPAGNLLSNITGTTAAPVANTLTATIDAAIGSTQGDILYRGATNWAALAPGTAGQILVSNGTAANPSWFTQTTVVNSIAADVALNNTANYFDGPSTAQGTAGTWLANGTVTLTDTVGAVTFYCKLWDGTTVISSLVTNNNGANFYTTASLSGVIASPAANIRISCRDITDTTGAIKANFSGNGKDSTLTVVRLR